MLRGSQKLLFLATRIFLIRASQLYDSEAGSLGLFLLPLGRPGPLLPSAILASRASRSRVFLFLLPFGLPGLRFGGCSTNPAAMAASRASVFLFLLPGGRPGPRLA